MTSLGLILVGIAAAEPPAYNPAPASRALHEAAQTTLAAVNDALAVNIVKETVPAEKANLDRLAQHAGEAKQAAQALLSAGVEPLGELKALTQGTSSRPSVSRRFKDGSDAVAALSERLRADNDAESSANARANGLSDPDKKARAKALVADARRALDAARGELGEAGQALDALKERRDAVGSAAFRLNSAEDELERAANALLRRADSAQSTTSDAKAALDALGDDNASKARAFDLTAKAEDDGKAVFNQASAGAAGSEDFASRYAALLSASSAFAQAEKSLKDKLAACDDSLSAVERTLSSPELNR